MDKKVNYQQLKKDDIAELHKEAEEKLKAKDAEMESIKGEMSELKQMFMAMLANNGQQQQQVVVKNKVEDIFVGCVGYKKIAVHADGKEITFTPDGSYMPLTREEVNSLVKSRYKNLFINGLLRFENKELYEDFRVYPVIDFTEDGVKELFSKEPNEMINIIKEAQKKSPRPYAITHNIQYIVAAMLVDNELPFDFNKLEPLEKFLKADIRGEAANNVRRARDAGYYQR